MGRTEVLRVGRCAGYRRTNSPPSPRIEWAGVGSPIIPSFSRITNESPQIGHGVADEGVRGQRTAPLAIGLMLAVAAMNPSRAIAQCDEIEYGWTQTFAGGSSNGDVVAFSP